MNSSSTANLIVDRSKRLFTFLRELTASRMTSIKQVDDYEEVLWLDDLPREPGWLCAAWTAEPSKEEDSGIWIQAVKPKLKKPPKPSDGLAAWLEQSEIEDAKRENPPQLKEEFFETHKRKNEQGEIEEYTVAISLKDHPEISAAWTEYINGEWKPWSEETQRLLKIQEIYGKLFAIYQKQIRLGESFEVVLGIGFLTLSPEGSAEVRRHIVTAQTEISFESARGILRVGPAGDGANLALEHDMLDLKDRPDNDKLIAEQLAQLGDEIWDRSSIDVIFRSWVNFVSSEGQYDESLARQAASKPTPTVHFAPALILRKRTERSLLRVFQEIVDQLEETNETADVPPGIVSAVSVVEKRGEGGLDEHPIEPGDYSNGNDEVYFPLPANDQQKRIIKLFADHSGVVVQGPPGTGKSQTIANLICHLLANGKRILITSQTARALESLKDKIPEPLRALCVSLLGNDRKAFEGLEGSVLGITNRFNSWDGRTTARLISTAKEELHKVREREATIRRDLRTIRESEVATHNAPFGDYSGKLSKISIRVKSERARFEWSASHVKDSSPPVTNSEVLELLQMVRAITREKQTELLAFNFELKAVPAPGEFEELVNKETALQKDVSSYHPLGSDQEISVIRNLAEATRKDLQSEIKSIRSKLLEMKGHIHTWVERAVTEVLGERDRVWRDLLAQTEAALKEVEDTYSDAAKHRVIIKTELDLMSVRTDCERLLAHMSEGGKLKGILITPKIVKECAYFLKEVSFNARPLESKEAIEQFYRWVCVTESFNNLKRLWGRFVDLHDQGLTTLYAEYSDLCEPLKEMLKLYDRVGTVRGKVEQISGLTQPAWHDLDQLKRFSDYFNAVDAGLKLTEIRQHIENFRTAVSRVRDSGTTHPTLVQLISAIERRSVEDYRSVYAQISNLVAEKKRLARFLDLKTKLESVCPELARSILESTNGDDELEARLHSFEEAWNWCRVDRWLIDIANPETARRLARELEVLQGKVRKLVTELACEQSWTYFFDRLTEPQRQNLMAWAQNMKKIGKGTGKYASRHRAAARENLARCRSAIPAWIMPIYRIAESVEPRPKSFDVVIIDEASQSGPEALFLEYLADKIIVVGDDKQISPESVGVHREEVDTLRRKYLHDLPHKDNIGADDSFFDLARIRFPGFIRLREHFRCMPEIIQFSNNMFYAGEPLQPLKQFDSQRLEPVKPVFVAGGYEKGAKRTFNPSEAEAVVEHIRKCVGDPRYKGKSMGVIVLKNTSSQAHEIAKMLLDALGPEEVEARKLICGDPYDFQGDERDIIFISMVAAPRDDSKIQALTGERYNRPFNVAASRAKEQMWLFHSVQLADLSPQCLRYRLIEYAYNPRVEPSAFDHTKVFEDQLVEPFDSLFEQRVFLKIVGQGYRVIPQYDVAGYRIDLVVEGMNGRLAVECDGDFWHGADQYDKDSARQRQLERCGWTFWRVRESAFNRDADTAMSDLWKTLERCGILASSVHSSGGFATFKGNGASVAGTAEIVDVRSNDEIGEAEDLEEDLLVDGEAISGEVVSFDPNLFEEPYKSLTGRTLPDPRVASQKLVVEGLVSLAEVEGPIQSGYLFRQYIRHAGIGKLGHQIEGLLARALEKAIRSGLLEKSNERNLKDRLQWTVRIAGGSFVRLRPAAGRMLDDIPPSEIGKLMKMFLNKGKLDEEELFRKVLGAYGMKRITTNIREILSCAANNWVNPSEERTKAEPVSSEDIVAPCVDTVPTPSYFDNDDPQIN